MVDALHRWMAGLPRWLWAVGGFALAAVILWAGNQPGATLPDLRLRLPHEDKLKHFLAYALVGAMLFRWRYPFQAWRPAVGRWPWLPALALPLAFGALDELNQSTVPGRSSELADIAADGLGGAAAVAVGLWLRARARRGR